MTTSIYNTKYVIYMHTNTITNKSYIGKTVHGMEFRWLNHISQAYTKTDNFKLYNSIRKHGTDCWKHEIIYVSFDRDDNHLYEIEEQLIRRFDTFNDGYNSDGGGIGTNSGENHPFFGKHHTEETRQKISRANSSENHYLYGKSISEEVKAKMSLAQSGEKSHMYGKHLSNETKEKLSKSHSGKNNINFKGYYVYNNNKYVISKSLGEYINVSSRTVRIWCKNSTKIICNKSYTNSPFIQSLGIRDEIVGKTFADIGFSFEPI